MLVSPLVALAFEMVVYVAEVSGLRERADGQRATVEFDFGAQLVAWNSFAMTYLLLGIRAFSRHRTASQIDHLDASACGSITGRRTEREPVGEPIDSNRAGSW